MLVCDGGIVALFLTTNEDWKYNLAGHCSKLRIEDLTCKRRTLYWTVLRGFAE
jgi:hypothetical protein